MFFVFNKQKIYSYIVAASTVVILFAVSAFLIREDTNTIETTSNVYTNKTNSAIDYNNLID